MLRSSKQSPEIKEYILNNVRSYPTRVAALTIKKFGLSRTSVSNYMQRLVKDGLLIAEGNTKARKYTLKKIREETFAIKVFRDMPEHHIWQFRILPLMRDIKENIVQICEYGFTEMLNNVADHSASPDATISYEQYYDEIGIYVIDHGVGIFKKIQKDFHLSDPREAIIELSKGKLTSDKTRHSGEGIFFTSRMFDGFSISSYGLSYGRRRKHKRDVLMEVKDTEEHKGTLVHMRISLTAKWTTKEIFDEYMGDSLRFRKTFVPVSLARYPGEQLVSRSQAKRILSRFEKFSEVALDFDGITTIGQPFADEIFRVFKEAHPDIPLYAVNTTPDIDRMITFVQANTEKYE